MALLLTLQIQISSIPPKVEKITIKACIHHHSTKLFSNNFHSTYMLRANHESGTIRGLRCAKCFEQHNLWIVQTVAVHNINIIPQNC